MKLKVNMRLTSSLAYTRATPVPKMPPGLVELMEGLTKDVLKNNPSNVYEFCANHLEKLLEIRDGPLPGKSVTLEEKIAKAQEKVRQRAKERQQHYDNKVQSYVKHPVEHDASENVNSGEVQDVAELVPNLRAPVHHDQELSLSSEVEISHEPTDSNSITSKDSNFDDSDDIPISKSSTFSSFSKSTVIDLMAGNDHEFTDKENVDGVIVNIEIPKMEINKDKREEENEVVNPQNNEIVKDDNIDMPIIEINNDEPDKKITIIVDDKEDEIAIDKNAEPSDDKDKIKENIEELTTQVVKEESDPVFKIPDEENLAKELDNTLELQPSDFVKSDNRNEHEINLKSLDEVNVMVEGNQEMINEIEPKNGPTDEIETDINLEVVRNDIEDPTIILAEGNITNDNPNELVSTYNVDDEKSEINQVTNISAGSLNETTQSESVNDSENILTTNDLNPNENSQKIEDTNDSVKVTDIAEEKISKPDSMEKSNIENKSEGIKTGYDEKKDVFENKSTENSSHKTLINLNNLVDSDDLEDKHSMMFSGDEEKVSKEDYANSPHHRPGSIKNNDDSSVIGSDLSKIEDDINRSDNEIEKNNMNLETAAETIQKVFRSFLFKSRNSTFEDITNDEDTLLDEDNDKNKEEYYATANLHKERRPLGITRMDTVLQTVNEEKSLSLSTDDSSTLSSAATTIQAHVRGFLVRNRLNSYKTVSTNSLVNSNEMLDTDTEQQRNKTVLNIHIVPEEGNYLSRDESLITSMDLSLDESPPSSVNLHPLSYDLVSERRKLLKREDAIQSVSPPSNNSGKLSEDSVKEVLNENDVSKTESNNEKYHPNPQNNSTETLVNSVDAVTIREQDDNDMTTKGNINKKDHSNPENSSTETLVNSVDAVTVRETSNEQEDNDMTTESNINKKDHSNPENNLTETLVNSVDVRETSKELEANQMITESNINEKDHPNPENKRKEQNSTETLVTAVNAVIVSETSNEQEDNDIAERHKRSMSPDESDVVTPYVASPRSLAGDIENTPKLIHSGEFHDVVLPTKVSRSDTTVVREFKNVLAYILLWNNS